MFQFPGFAQNPYLIQGLVPHYDNWKPKTACHHTASEFQLSEVGFPIQKSTDQSLFAAPHGLSQRTTSFIASQCQGIHRTPLRHLIALMIDAHPSAEVAQVSCALGHRRNKTSLLHDLTRTGGQAQSQSSTLWVEPEGPAIPVKSPLHDVGQPAQRSDDPRAKLSAFLADGILVEPDGIEPTTSCLQSTRSPS